MSLVRVLYPMYNLIWSCYMNCGRVCVREYLSGYGEELSTRVSVFDVKQTSDDTQGGHITVNECPATTDFQTHTEVMFKKTKVLIRTNNDVHVISLNTTPLHHSTFKVKPGLSILGFIEPTLLLMCNEDTELISKVRVYHTTTGEFLRGWKNTGLYKNVSRNYFDNLEYPSKLILSGKGELMARLINF